MQSRLPLPHRRSLAALLLGLLGVLSAASSESACGGEPVGGDCAIKVNCFAADCKTTVRENACICPDGSKTADQCATPAADAGTVKDAIATDSATDSSTSDGSFKDSAADSAPSDAAGD